MELWIIEPHDPLIVRDGRPFGPTPGARARPLDFPFPSTIAGGLRTRAGQNPDGVFDPSKENIDAVEQIGVRGPLLVELDGQEEVDYLVPAPGDALLMKDHEDGKVYRHRLRPILMDDTLSDIPDKLHPVGLVKPDLRKPYKDAPHFWRWDSFVQWLIAPPDKIEEITPTELGHKGPGKEWRVHVKIDPSSFTGEEGALFATGGLEFWQRPSDEKRKLSSVKRLALAAAVTNLNGLSIEEAFAPLGGERRMMRWYKGQKLPSLPEPDGLDGLAEAIAKTGHCRLILLTPAFFKSGWKPDWLLQERYGITPELKAAIVGKPQTVSGWDFKKREAKPTRRLVPAGAVYYLKLSEDTASNKAWIKTMWLQNISDEPQNRLDGFGLAAVGAWSGDSTPMISEEIK